MAYKPHITTNLLFGKTKSKAETEDRSNVAYEIKCNGGKSDIYQQVYVDTTKPKLKSRLSSHRSDQKALHKTIEQKTSLATYDALTGNKPNFDDVEIQTEETHYGGRYTLEMLLIIKVSTGKRLTFKRDINGKLDSN